MKDSVSIIIVSVVVFSMLYCFSLEMISSGMILEIIGRLLVMKIIELYLLMVWVKVSVKLVSRVGKMVGKIILMKVCQCEVLSEVVVFLILVLIFLIIGCSVCMMKGSVMKVRVKMMLSGVQVILMLSGLMNWLSQLLLVYSVVSVMLVIVVGSVKGRLISVLMKCLLGKEQCISIYVIIRLKKVLIVVVSSDVLKVM